MLLGVLICTTFEHFLTNLILLPTPRDLLEKQNRSHTFINSGAIYVLGLYNNCEFPCLKKIIKMSLKYFIYDW